MYDALHRLLLGAFPPATRIVDVRSYRPQYLPYPAVVTLDTGNDAHEYCVIKVAERFETLAQEARALRALGDLGCPFLLCLPARCSWTMMGIRSLPWS